MYLVEGFGLTGTECKNLVPVDWVSAAMTQILSQPENHGRTYHLVTRRPPPLVLLANVIQQAVEECSTLADEQDELVGDAAWFLDSFRQQMEIYRTYWRDDPCFDDSQRASAVSIDCPEMDAAMMLKLAKFAIANEFGKRRQRSTRPEFDVHEHMRGLAGHHRPLVQHLVGNHCLGLDVRGPAGGQWKLLLRDGRLVAVEDGISPQCSAVFRLESPTFRALRSRHLAVVDALRSGRVVIHGNGLDPAHLAAILQAAAIGGAAELAKTPA
jgi:hypothetical protein